LRRFADTSNDEMHSAGSPPNNTRALSRRRFLKLAGTGLLSALGPARLLAGDPASAAVRAWRWSDPATWGGRVPGERDVAVITKKVILDVNARVAGVVIKDGGQLIFHPSRTVTLRSTGNVIVHGRLAMRPYGPRKIHRLIFLRVNERKFVGGGVKVLRSDVGLWVMGMGVLDVVGSPRLAWTRVEGAVPAGTTTIVLQEDPVGWQVGDRLALTPTLPPTVPRHYEAYDYPMVSAISGRTITLSRATTFNHPAVSVGRDVTMTAEVLNLTRNVVIQGTPRGRAHVFIHSMHSQRVKHACLRYLGPRQPDKRPGITRPVLGRYGLHFHHCEDGSRGSLVVGVVARDIGNHAFVTHTSHGVTFRGCISHDTFEDAFFWDNRRDRFSPAPPTNNTLYDRCVASRVRHDPPFEGYGMGGFFLGRGNGNVAQGCVAVGVDADKNSCGFVWPEGSEGIWTFADCVAHNSRWHGIFVWQVTANVHTITRFVGYHNGFAGVFHGAYGNPYRYQDLLLYGNKAVQFFSWAISAGDYARLLFENVVCDAAGLSDYSMILAGRMTGPDGYFSKVGLVRNCSFIGHKKAAVKLTWDFHDVNASKAAALWELVDCTYEGTEFWVTDDVHPSTRLYVQDAVHGSITLARSDQPGEYRPDWNASVSGR
jgi:G8 domain-containing protein